MAITIPLGTEGMVLHEELTRAEVLESNIDRLRVAQSEDELVQAAMAEPIASPRLRELAAGKKTCTVIISDHTRPVPSRHILPFLLEELRQGNPAIEITLLVATGCHRASSAEELAAKLGPKIMAKEKIVIHDSQDPSGNVKVGVLPSGADLVIDRLAAETDRKSVV